jgi:hypothetical protein
MPPALGIGSHRDSAKDRIRSHDVNSDNADRLTSIDQELRMITRCSLIRMVLVVGAELAPCLEENQTTNVVVRTPRRWILR